MGVRPLVLAFALAAALGVASDAPAGGIADEPCPNVAGENTNTCPPGTVGAPYAIRFVEREGSGCGPGRQTFHLDSGVLPPGFELASDGRLSGTAIQPGTFHFYVQMRGPQDDSEHCAGKKTEKRFALKIRRQLSLVSPPLAPLRSEVGVPFRMTLRARGGTGFFRWALVGGRLPAGVRLRVDGSIAGTPRAAGTYYLEVRVRDTETRSANWGGTVTVARRLLIRSRRLPAAEVGRPYRANFEAAGGVAPRVWKLERGRLPPGIRLASALGSLTGAAKKPARYPVTVQVRDGLLAKSRRTFTVVVHRPQPRGVRSTKS